MTSPEVIFTICREPEGERPYHLRNLHANVFAVSIDIVSFVWPLALLKCGHPSLHPVGVGSDFSLKLASSLPRRLDLFHGSCFVLPVEETELSLGTFFCTARLTISRIDCSSGLNSVSIFSVRFASLVTFLIVSDTRFEARVAAHSKKKLSAKHFADFTNSSASTSSEEALVWKDSLQTR